MKLREAIGLLNDAGEHKFLLDVAGSWPVFIVDVPLNSDTKRRMLTHEDLTANLRSAGIFGEVEVRGGYCLVHQNILRYWGESTIPIRGAGKHMFENAIQDRSISFINMFGTVVKK